MEKCKQMICKLSNDLQNEWFAARNRTFWNVKQYLNGKISINAI